MSYGSSSMGWMSSDGNHSVSDEFIYSYGNTPNDALTWSPTTPHSPVKSHRVSIGGAPSRSAAEGDRHNVNPRAGVILRRFNPEHAVAYSPCIRARQYQTMPCHTRSLPISVNVPPPRLLTRPVPFACEPSSSPCTSRSPPNFPLRAPESAPNLNPDKSACKCICKSLPPLAQQKLCPSLEKTTPQKLTHGHTATQYLQQKYSPVSSYNQLLRS